MPINKCASRLKLQYTAQIQQSEWHSPCRAHHCAPLQTEHQASANSVRTSKTLTKPKRQRRREDNRGREKSWLLSNLKRPNPTNIKVTDPMLIFHASNLSQNLQSLWNESLSLHTSCRSHKSVFLFFPAPAPPLSTSPPSLFCCLFQSLTLSPGKRS